MDSIEEKDGYKELVPFIRKIKTQHEDIMKSAKMRQVFTANVSHELKTPLTSISGYAELIENGMAADDDLSLIHISFTSFWGKKSMKVCRIML